MPTVDGLLKEALELGVRDRAMLAEELLASIDEGDSELSESEADRLWIKEAERRLEEHNSGRGGAIPSATVAAKAEKLCGEPDGVRSRSRGRIPRKSNNSNNALAAWVVVSSARFIEPKG